MSTWLASHYPWRLAGGRFELAVTISVNPEATVHVSGRIQATGGVRPETEENNTAFQVDAGCSVFVSTMA